MFSFFCWYLKHLRLLLLQKLVASKICQSFENKIGWYYVTGWDNFVWKVESQKSVFSADSSVSKILTYVKNFSVLGGITSKPACDKGRSF